MTLLIMWNGECVSVVYSVPGNLKPSQILTMWLEYHGCESSTFNQYTATWVNNSHYHAMRRWRELNGSKPAI